MIIATVVRRFVVPGVVVAAGLAILPAAAGADHTHSKQTGNGSCVLLAANGAEDLVELPFATDEQVDTVRAHPLHLLVHKGKPGSDGSITVAGSDADPCAADGDYLNAR